MEKLIVKFFVYAVCYTSDQKLNNKTALPIAELLIDSKVSRFPIDTICLLYCFLGHDDTCDTAFMISTDAMLI
ncbi:hypothetical protein T12_2023 [Trichinella patagoniensis]|uniref:Uncharacterized protein n=1 Tax=Trichinella patagoniensis TaxID=990121 RepID=A0A0V1A480_9BILA|nr:hypothetical protein T12_2023 [Trichinella patagoniensis]